MRFDYPTMSRLDHLASMAMQGLLANKEHAEWSVMDIAETAYAMAEAMLKERQKYAQ